MTVVMIESGWGWETNRHSACGLTCNQDWVYKTSSICGSPPSVGTGARTREDSLILLSLTPTTASDLLGGVTTVTHLLLFCSVLPEGEAQIVVKGGAEDTGIVVVTVPGTLVMSNHPFTTPSFVTLANSIVCSWILLRAPRNSSTTFVELITFPSATADKSSPEVGG